MNMYMLSNLSQNLSDRGLDEILTLLKSNPRAIDTLTSSEKLSMILFVAGLGMLVTFAVLLFLWFCISMLSNVFKRADKKKAAQTAVKEVAPAPVAEVVVEEEEDDEELIAVISAAVAASLNTSIHNIVVRNIVRVNNQSPSYAQAGRIEQMNTRF